MYILIHLLGGERRVVDVGARVDAPELCRRVFRGPLGRRELQ